MFLSTACERWSCLTLCTIKKATVYILRIVADFFLIGLCLANVLSVLIIGKHENDRQHYKALNI